MKKIILIIGILVIIAGIGLYFNDFRSLVTMRKTVATKDSGRGLCGFEAEKGEILKVSYNSEVKEGNLKIQISEKDTNNVVKAINANEKGKQDVEFKDSGTYELTAEYNDFKGKYKIKINK